MNKTISYLFLSLLLMLLLIGGLSHFLWGQTKASARALLENEGQNLVESILSGTRFGLASFEDKKDFMAGIMKEYAQWLDRALPGRPDTDRETIAASLWRSRAHAVRVLEPDLAVLAEVVLPPPPDINPGAWARHGHGRGRGGPGPLCPWGMMGAPPRAELEAFYKSADSARVWGVPGVSGCGGPPEVTVAVKRKKGGMILVSALLHPQDAQRPAGIARLFHALALSPKIRYVALVDANGVVLAHSDWSQIGKPFQPPAEPAGRVLVISRKAPLGAGREALLVAALSTEQMAKGLERAKNNILLFALVAAMLGCAGLLAIYRLQVVHAGRVRTLEEAVSREKRLASLGRMAAGVAHEVRNPLNAMSLTVARLKKEVRPQGPDQEVFTGYTDLIHKEILRLNKIVEDFLRLARPSNLRLERSDAGALCENLAALYQEEALSLGIALVVERPPEPLFAVMDEESMRQALGNVLKNSLQACAHGDRVTLSARREGPDAVLSVQDTGPGIPPADLEKVFEPFYTTKSRGSGLGLAMALRAAEEHGGTMSVKNLDKGARAEIRIPANGRA